MHNSLTQLTFFLFFSSPSQTNALYHTAFEEWAAEFPNVKILSDQTRSNDVNHAFMNIINVDVIIYCYLVIFCPRRVVL